MLKEKILSIANRKNKSLNVTEYARLLELDEDYVRVALDNLIDEGYFRKNRNNRYVLIERTDFEVGTLDMTKRGFGFVVMEGEDDIFVHSKYLGGALNGDKVLVKVTKNTGRREGEIKKVLKREKTIYTGQIEKLENFAFVRPTDKNLNFDIYVKSRDLYKAKNGDIVQVEITKGPIDGNKPEGRVIKVLGNEESLEVQKKIIVSEHQIRDTFDKEIFEELKGTTFEDDRDERRDLRDELIITIDGSDSKDLDDAISIKKTKKGYELGVHIADVTHYVKEGSLLDKEAFNRGTSVYLIDSVIPMLPKELSNGLCSLNAGEDKLCLSLVIDLDEKGNILSHDIFKSVIKSSYRLVYDDVSDFLEAKTDNEELSKIRDTLFHMMDLAKMIREKRYKSGSIDFDFNESKIIIDKHGEVEDIKLRDRRIANRIIEEFMILANEVVSEHFYWLETPFLYRVHEKPDPEKISSLKSIIKPFGYIIKGDINGIGPKSLNTVIENAKGKKEEHLINRLVLRSLKQAKYSVDALGHFGLGLKYYSHFTSPIRRYPDLQIHRIIKEVIANTFSSKRKAHYTDILPLVAENSSITERVAESAERDYDDFVKAYYMRDKIGSEYDTFVSGVVEFGVFAEIENTVEGLIRVDILPGDYNYDRDTGSMREIRKNGKAIYIGDKIRVKCVNVNVTKSEVDFEIVRFYE